MKIMFSTRPAFGHVYPLMPLALAARAARHEVSFATTGRFLPALGALGFPTFDVGVTIEQARDRALEAVDGDGMPKGSDGRPDLRFGARLFLDVLARATIADLAPVVQRERPDLVVYEQGEFGAAIVAHAAGIPAVCHSVSPRMPRPVIELVSVAGGLDRLWAEAGVPQPALDVFTGDRFIDIFPEVLQDPGFLDHPRRIRMRPIPFAEPGAAVPGWVGRADRPVVYLTLGTVVATDEVLRPAIDGLATLDAEVLLALGSANGAELGTMPANVHVATFVDQAALVPRVDLVVHHGGSGTILTALANGTPQLLLPKGADQFMNADAMRTAGLADAIEPADATPDTVATMAKVAMVDRRTEVDVVREEIAGMPHPRDVVELLAADFGPT